LYRCGNIFVAICLLGTDELVEKTTTFISCCTKRFDSSWTYSTSYSVGKNGYLPSGNSTV